MTAKSKSKSMSCGTRTTKKKTVAKRERNDGRSEIYRWSDRLFIVVKAWGLVESLIEYSKEYFF